MAFAIVKISAILLIPVMTEVAHDNNIRSDQCKY